MLFSKTLFLYVGRRLCFLWFLFTFISNAKESSKRDATATLINRYCVGKFLIEYFAREVFYLFINLNEKASKICGYIYTDT